MSFQKPFFVRKGNQYQQIKLEEILFIQAEDNYVRMHVITGEDFLIYSSLQRLEQSFIIEDEPALFVRTHRSYIINLLALKKWDTDTNELHIGGYVLPLSRQKRKDLEKALTILG